MEFQPRPPWVTAVSFCLLTTPRKKASCHLENFLCYRDRLAQSRPRFYTCDDLHSKGSSPTAPDLAVQSDCVRGTSPEAWDFHGAQAARNSETVNFFGLASLLDPNDKLLIDPIWGGPVQSERVPANLGHCDVFQIWNLFCIRTERLSYGNRPSHAEIQVR